MHSQAGLPYSGTQAGGLAGTLGNSARANAKFPSFGEAESPAPLDAGALLRRPSGVLVDSTAHGTVCPGSKEGSQHPGL